MHEVFRKTLLILLGAAGALAVSTSPAVACDSFGCLLASRSASGLLPKGKMRVDFSARHIDQSRRLSGASSTDRVIRPWVDFRDGRIWSGIHDDMGGQQSLLQADVEYGLSTGAVVFASVPVFSQRRFKSGDEVCGLVDGTSGMGDMVVGYRRAIHARPDRILVATFALKLPTGRAGTRRSTTQLILDPMFQTGTGSVDGVGSLQYTFKALHHDLDWTASASYQHATKNALNYRFGSQAIGAVTVSRSLTRRFTGSLQIKGLHQTRSEFFGRSLGATGSSSLFASPGLRWTKGRQSLYSIVQLPIVTYVNETQLAPRYAVILGMSRTL